MANDWDDNDNDDNSKGPKALRDHLAKVEAELKAERERNAKLEADNRQVKLTDILRSEGYNPKIAALVPSVVEADGEKLKAWLADHAELFPKAENASPEGEVIRKDVSNDEGQGQSEDRIAAAASAGLPPDRYRDLETQLDNAKTPEELEKIMAANRHIKFK